MTRVARIGVICLCCMALIAVALGLKKAVSAWRFHALVSSVEERFDEPAFAHAHWGVLIQSLTTGRVWYERNADRLFNPGSNQKLLTVAAALKSLGPDYRFQTVVCTDGAVTSSSIDGNLIVIGNGDPTINAHFHKRSADVFRGWAAQLRQQGITSIKGNIIGDDNAWDNEHFCDAWTIDNLEYRYAAGFGALQFNENCHELKVVAPKDAAGTVTVTALPPGNYYRLVNKLTLAGGSGTRVSMVRDYRSIDIVVSGAVSPGSKPVVRSLTVANPTLYYVGALREVLKQEGIAVAGEALDCDDIPGWGDRKPADFRQLIVHRSPPLSELTVVMLKKSLTYCAETLVRAMGQADSGRGTFAGGRKVVEQQLQALGIAPGTYAYLDGSGMTRQDYVSLRQIVAIHRGMHASPHWPLWRDSLSIAGVDGTLDKRMKGTAAQGRVRAKTGTLDNVRAISGYVTTAADEELAFCFLVNGHLRSQRETEKVTDGVLALLAGYDSRH